MRPLTGHTGRCLPLRRGDVDTDQIIPAEHCRKLTRSGYSDALFARWRQDPAFVLNDPTRRDASVLVAGPNFGTGSSREHAVWALRDWGVRAVVPPSFGDIFQRNALRNGLLVAQLPEPVVGGLLGAAEADSAFELTVDLVSRRVVAGEEHWSFDIDERSRWLLLNGFDEIEVTLSKKDEIAAYESRRASWLPRPSAS